MLVATLVVAGAGTGCGRALDADGQLAGSVADVAKCSGSFAAAAAEPMPADLPTPPATHPYDYATQGKTRIWFTTLPGTSSRLVALRDDIRSRLVAAGYHEVSSDQEPGAEADLAFAGPRDGTAQVRPLCHGRVRVRYVVNS